LRIALDTGKRNNMSFILAIPRAFVLAGFDMIEIFLNFYFWVLIVGAIISWLIAFGAINTYNRFVQTVNDTVNSLTEPVLAPIRRAIPPMGGFDLSPLVLILSIVIFQRYFLPSIFVLFYNLFASMALPSETAASIANPVHIVYLLLDIYIWLIIIGVVLNWLIASGVISTRNEFVNKTNVFINRITNPLLKPLRRRLAFIRGADMSLLALIFLIIFVQHFLIHLIV
jgi:YggT family protein